LTYRITFAVTARARFLAHLETVDTLLAALRRAGYDIALSRGMKPKPVISLALPRAVGVESECELADVELLADPAPEELIEALGAQLPRGITVLAAERVEGRPASSRLRAARYRIEVAEDLDWDGAVRLFLASDEAVVTRRLLGKPDKRVDVRRFCSSLDHRHEVLEAELELSDGGTARPEEVAQSVAAQVGATPTVNRIVRTAIELRDTPAGATA
jgi:radical SAM-linked protein